MIDPKQIEVESKDQLGDRMKQHETIETGRRLDITLPVYARIDGRGFSRFTRGMNRPYDERMSRAMIETTKHLVKHTSALIGYTQSDEISLGWRVDIERNPLADMWFSGKVMKLSSVLAGMATAAFTRAVLTSEDEEFRAYAERLPHFDARVFNLPDDDELANAFLWRELDASRNAVQMAASAEFSHKQLHGKSCAVMREMLAQAGIDFEAYPALFKRGTYVRTQMVEKGVSELPEAARACMWIDTEGTHMGVPLGKVFMIDGATGVGRSISRSVVEPIEVPRFLSIANRPEFILGADPVIIDG